MNNRLFKWIELNKNKEKPIILLLKFLYSITYDWIYNVLIIIIPIVLSNCEGKMYYILMIILVLITIWYTQVNAYKKKRYKIEQGIKMVLEHINLCITSLDEYINNNCDGDGIFETACDLVSSSLYKTITNYTNCQIRISIIGQFIEKGKKNCVMLSRKSMNREICTKSQRRVNYKGNTDYYYLKILSDNNDDMIILNKEEIENNFCYNSKIKSNICQYIGIPDKYNTDNIIYLIQLDAMEENIFGKTEEEIKLFYKNFIYPYISFLRHAYNME